MARQEQSVVIVRAPKLYGPFIAPPLPCVIGSLAEQLP